MGEGFSDWYAWYLKEVIESAREPDPEPPLSVPLALPGLATSTGITKAIASERKYTASVGLS